MKSAMPEYKNKKDACRSREGAWIEICVAHAAGPPRFVAPVRERGLKYQDTSKRSPHGSRSREGAWIEILENYSGISYTSVAPVRERGLKLPERY